MGTIEINLHCEFKIWEVIKKNISNYTKLYYYSTIPQQFQNHHGFLDFLSNFNINVFLINEFAFKDDDTLWLFVSCPVAIYPCLTFFVTKAKTII